MKTLFGLCLLLVPVGLVAQEGSVTYDHTVVYAFANQEDSTEASEGRGEGAQRGRQARAGARRGGMSGFTPSRMPEGMPTNSYASVVLHFNAFESVMVQSEAEEQEEHEHEEIAVAGAAHSPGDMAGFAAMIRRGSPIRSDQETLLGAYTSNADGSLVQALEFMGRTFRIMGTIPVYEWRLVGEQSEFLGYMVQKAVATQGDSTIEAWFTPQIPVSAGPGQYGGLPGLILVLSVNRGEELYSATAADLAALEDGTITPPSEGDEISREEYEEMVTEKLEELRTSRGRARNHRIG